jgi:hypothetical protein
VQVEHHATGGFRTVALEEFFRRSKGFHSVISSPEKARQGAEKRQVVIYQIDDRRWQAARHALRDRLADAQPDSLALLFCRQRTLEQPRKLLLAKAGVTLISGHVSDVQFPFKFIGNFHYDGKPSEGKPLLALSCQR